MSPWDVFKKPEQFIAGIGLCCILHCLIYENENKQTNKKKSANRSFEENLKQALPNFFCLGLLWLLLVLALVSMSSFSWGKKKKKG